MRSTISVWAAVAVLVAVCLAPPAPAFAFNPLGRFAKAAGGEGKPQEMSEDRKISTTLKTALLERDQELGLAVKVHCFLGRVTLLGRISDDSFKAFAEHTAEKTRGVTSVATFWVAPGKKDTSAEDLEIEAKVRGAVAADKALASCQIEQEVFGGRVYLLGLVGSRAEAARAVAHARAVPGVTDVVSLLLHRPKKK